MDPEAMAKLPVVPHAYSWTFGISSEAVCLHM